MSGRRIALYVTLTLVTLVGAAACYIVLVVLGR